MQFLYEEQLCIKSVSYKHTEALRKLRLGQSVYDAV
jgi:hypothetical protein